MFLNCKKLDILFINIYKENDKKIIKIIDNSIHISSFDDEHHKKFNRMFPNTIGKKIKCDDEWKIEYFVMQNLHSYVPKYNEFFPNNCSEWHIMQIDSKMMYNYVIYNWEKINEYDDFVLSYIDNNIEMPITFKKPNRNKLPQPWTNKYVDMSIIMYKGPREKPLLLENDQIAYYVILTFKQRGTFIMKKIKNHQIELTSIVSIE